MVNLLCHDPSIILDQKKLKSLYFAVRHIKQIPIVPELDEGTQARRSVRSELMIQTGGRRWLWVQCG